MKRSSKSLTLVLMISSIILLLILQALWIINSYERAYFDLRRDASILLRGTVAAMRDSLLAHNIERIPDSGGSSRYTFSNLSDTVLTRAFKEPKKIKSINVNTATSEVQVFISTDRNANHDSVKSIIKPLAARFTETRFSNGGRFVIRMGPDTLSRDSLRSHLYKALDNAGILTDFTIKEFKFVPPLPEINRHKGAFRDGDEHEPPLKPHVFSDTLYTDWVRYNPVQRYSMVMSSFRPLLIKAIAPQLMFSLFLTAITIAAFVLLYHNLRSQQRLMEIKNDFISNMTHELKTPIATVSVALEALKNFSGIDNPKLTAEYLDIAQHELNRLTLLTDKVLKTSLFEEQGISYVPEVVDMQKTIEQVLSSMKLVFEKHKASVTFSKHGNDFIVMGGSIHLTNVIYNLLDNALKYSPGAAQINITLKDDEDKITLSVQDNGIGIAPEYTSKIFEKFFRVPTGDVHTTKGYGLGLNYVDKVIASHRGKITVESKVQEGSTFIIRIPKR